MSRRRPLRPSSEEEDVDLASNEDSKYNPSSVPGAEEPYNPLSWLGLPWHLAMFVFYCLLMRHSSNLMDNEEFLLAVDPHGKIPRMGGRFKFLSHINCWIQLGFFGVQLLADLSPGPFKMRLQRLADLAFTIIAFPLATLVAAIFWGLYAVDRKLIYPEVYDELIPTYMNHFWHTTVLLWVMCEVYLVHHRFPSVAWAAASVFVYGSAYNMWIVYIYVTTGWWVYPFMKHLPPYGMALFLSSSMFFGLGLHVLGKWVARLRWGITTHLEGY